MAPAEVTYEDIISINAQTSQLHPRKDEPKTTPESPAPPSTAMSFLSSWIPLEGAEKPQPVQRGPERSVHHFCTVTEDIQLPDHLRGTWRKYHVPNKYEFLQNKKDVSKILYNYMNDCSFVDAISYPTFVKFCSYMNIQYLEL